MRYEIIGPLRAVDDEGEYAIRARKVEILLTVLLVRADQIVPIDQLMTEIWGGHPPRRALAGLHVYISQIRKFLHRPGQAQSPVTTRPPGYLLHLGDDELDYRCFERLVNQGRDRYRRRKYEQAATAFDNALALWSAPVDAVCHGPILEGFQSWLSETHLECVEMLMDSRLMLGRHRELVSDLYQLTTEHPLREALHGQLMLALYRSGRQADALQVYRSTRRTINEELGLEPCRALQDLQQGILSSDARLELRLSA
ncbi:MAG: AfsR/SARP family transcriptional regulator [Streptosporangiaceae bacterium]